MCKPSPWVSLIQVSKNLCLFLFEVSVSFSLEIFDVLFHGTLHSVTKIPCISLGCFTNLFSWLLNKLACLVYSFKYLILSWITIHDCSKFSVCICNLCVNGWLYCIKLSIYIYDTVLDEFFSNTISPFLNLIEFTVKLFNAFFDLWDHLSIEIDFVENTLTIDNISDCSKLFSPVSIKLSLDTFKVWFPCFSQWS